VKKHTIHLYEKLHVSGRREAVEKATALGYLEPG
jgi:ATP/maltotriose-dependent transcriptional regulator MalT